jgi:hypothetical protein
LHLLEDRVAPGPKDAAHNDVADLAARMAADDRDRPPGAHVATITRARRGVSS